MPEWFEAMTTPGKIGFLVGLLGGLAGLGSLWANLVMARANRGMERLTAKSVEIAEQATALTRDSVQDQIETNRFSRSARVGIMTGSYQSLQGEKPRKSWSFDGELMIAPGTTGLMELTVVNEGAAPAFGVQVFADDDEQRSIPGKMRWSPDDPTRPFTSAPFTSWSVLPPSETKSCKFAIRNSDEQGNLKTELKVMFSVLYSDGLGPHARSFELSFFGTSLEWKSPGLIFERPWPGYEFAGEGQVQEPEVPA